MPVLEISKTGGTGERCWTLTLTTDDGRPILRATTPLVKGVAHDAAKALIQKGPDAPFVEGNPAPGRPAWAAEKDDDSWLLRFTLVSETRFDPLLKPEDLNDIKNAEHTVIGIRTNLRKADVKWNPPEADPAFAIKEADLTEPLGYPGS
ncbi:MAG: hypothetical protein OXI46_00075 [Gemmatimonadota bacterium]|nr:hypothetical protein [Gemmatimonadota bacterium]